MARLTLTLLGGFRAHLDPGALLAIQTRKAQALIAYLAMPLGAVHSRDKLASLLWGNTMETTARTSLRQTLHGLGRNLQGAHDHPLRMDGDTVSLDPSSVAVDVGEFEQRVAQGTPEALAVAATLYQGALLEGIAVQEPRFEEWLLRERERLHEVALKALAKLLAHQRQAESAEAAIETALRLLALDPLQEAVHRALMQLYAESGRRGAALRQYQTCLATLRRELHMEPGRETKALYAEILREPALAVPIAEREPPTNPAERILTSRGALEGERKQVTVLFANLRGLMQLLADRDSEDARTLVDPVLERMMEAVRHYEGTVNQVMGDGIMALFGAPLAQEDHAVRACFAALKMQELVKQYAEETRDRHDVTIQIQVGLDSGEVVVRAIGSDLHMDYSAVGQTTHLAARMRELASPGSIFVTRATLELVQGHVSVKPRRSMKGLADEVEVYEVTGEVPRRSWFPAAVARDLTRLVGRDGELKQLHEALARAARGRGQVVAVIGEPGMGKSRLVWEIARSHRTHGWLILRTTAVSYGKTTPYLPVVDLLKDYFQVRQRDGLRAVREKAARRLRSVAGDLEPALQSLLELPVDNRQWEALDPPQRRHRTIDAVRRVLVRESQIQPVLIIFENLHWIDTETQAVLDRVVESLPTARILLLVNYRPEYRHTWSQKTDHVELKLDPLAPQQVDEMVETLLGSDVALKPLRRLLTSRTGGNPFFLEESVRSLADDDVIVGSRGAYRLATSGKSARVPATVQAVLAARLDRLATEDKELVQTAAVVGTEVPVTVLAAVTNTSQDVLTDALARLQANEFLYETSPPPDAEYAFKHALTHEVAYGSLLQDRRRAVHARAVEAVERLYPERLAEHVERLAHHAVRGQAWARAVTYLRQAGRKATERSAYGQAVASFEQALEALRYLPENREQAEQASDLHLDASGALVPLGELASSIGHARQAEAIAAAVGDQRRQGWALAILAHRAWYSGDSDRTLEMGQRALAIATDLKDVPLETSATFSLGLLTQTRGEYRRAVGHLRRTVEALKGDRLHDRHEGSGTLRAVFSRERLAWCLSELGEFSEARARAEEAVQIASEVDHHHSLVLAYRSLGFVAIRRGDITQAIGPLERAVELCRLIQTRSLFDVAAANLGYAYTLAGRVAEGVALMEEALNNPAATGTTNHPLLLTYLGGAHLVAGRSRDAITAAQRALDLAQKQNERGNEGWALRLLGEIAATAEAPDRDSAEEHYRRGLIRAAELSMRPLSAHCHLGLGKLFRRVGQGQQARQRLAAATAMYREMDMPFWREKTEAETRELA